MCFVLSPLQQRPRIPRPHPNVEIGRGAGKGAIMKRCNIVSTYGPPWGVLPSVNLGAHPRSDGAHFFLKFPTPEREGCQHWPRKMPYLKCRRHRGGEQHGQHCEELKKAKQERVRHGSRQAPVPPAPAEQFAAQAGSTRATKLKERAGKAGAGTPKDPAPGLDSSARGSTRNTPHKQSDGRAQAHQSKPVHRLAWPVQAALVIPT